MKTRIIYKEQHSLIKNQVFHAIYGACITAMLLLPFISSAEETPDSSAEKVATFKKEYPPFDLKKARSDAEKAYSMAKVGDEVEVSTPRGKLKGKFNGIQGDKIKVGLESIFISDLAGLEKIYFDQALCKKTRQVYVDNKLAAYTTDKNAATEKYKDSLAGKVESSSVQTTNKVKPVLKETQPQATKENSNIAIDKGKRGDSTWIRQEIDRIESITDKDKEDLKKTCEDGISKINKEYDEADGKIDRMKEETLADFEKIKRTTATPYYQLTAPITSKYDKCISQIKDDEKEKADAIKEKYAAKIKEAMALVGEEASFYVEQELSSSNFPDLKGVGKKLYQINDDSTNAILITTDTAFTTTGWARQRILPYKKTSVTYNDGRTENIPVFIESPAKAFDRYTEVIQDLNNQLDGLNVDTEKLVSDEKKKMESEISKMEDENKDIFKQYRDIEQKSQIVVAKTEGEATTLKKNLESERGERISNLELARDKKILLMEKEMSSVKECQQCNGTGSKKVKCQKCNEGNCSACRGEGGKDDKTFGFVKCTQCKGKGKCLACNGEGYKDHKCSSCNGVGKIILDISETSKNLKGEADELVNKAGKSESLSIVNSGKLFSMTATSLGMDGVSPSEARSSKNASSDLTATAELNPSTNNPIDNTRKATNVLGNADSKSVQFSVHDLCLFIIQGDFESIKKAVDNGVDVNQRDMDRIPPLHWGVISGNKQIVEYLISKGADVNLPGKNPDNTLLDGESSLDAAIRCTKKNKEEIIKILKANGAKTYKNTSSDLPASSETNSSTKNDSFNELSFDAGFKSGYNGVRNTDALNMYVKWWKNGTFESVIAPDDDFVKSQGGAYDKTFWKKGYIGGKTQCTKDYMNGVLR